MEMEHWRTLLIQPGKVYSTYSLPATDDIYVFCREHTQKLSVGWKTLSLSDLDIVLELKVISGLMEEGATPDREWIECVVNQIKLIDNPPKKLIGKPGCMLLWNNTRKLRICSALYQLWSKTAVFK